MTVRRQPWIYSATVDGPFILAPAFVITALVLLLQKSVTAVDAIPMWLWGVLIVGVDVGHVYSTLFRTYADPQERRAHPNLYFLVPFICWIGGTIIYSLSALWFWRALAYLAVFHFVRQQYGFMMIYGRRDDAAPLSRWIDKLAIYMATIYPLIYWHTHLPRNFNWFVESDFIAAPIPFLNWAGFALYIAVLGAYLIKEVVLICRNHQVNVPKNLLFIGTLLSWFVGIVYFNSDLAFTATNVVAHGVPYIALIWIYGRNRGSSAPKLALFRGLSFQQFFSFSMLPVYIGVLVLLGYFEEGLWDGFVWTEHGNFFHLFQALPAVSDTVLISWLIPLLALPQMTHYVLDAFIWRLNRRNTEWKQVLFYAVRPNVTQAQR